VVGWSQLSLIEEKTVATAKKTPASKDRELAVIQNSGTDEETANDVKKAPVRQDGEDFFIEVREKEFRLAPELGMMAALKFTAMQDDEDELDMSTLYLLLYSMIHEDDWTKFEKHTIMTRCTGDDLAMIIAGALESFGGRPTEEPSGS
jgi:hypothetical protein